MPVERHATITLLSLLQGILHFLYNYNYRNNVSPIQCHYYVILNHINYIHTCLLDLDSVICSIYISMRNVHRRSSFCCYILQSKCWHTPYTGKTCDLARRLHRHNHPSKRSRAYTKGKGPWRVAAVVFGLRSNRQSVWLERALKRHARHRARPAGLSAVQSAVLNAVRVASNPRLWWKEGVGEGQSPPTLHVHVFKCALASWPKEVDLEAQGQGTAPSQLSCHHQRDF